MFPQFPVFRPPCPGSQGPPYRGGTRGIPPVPGPGIPGIPLWERRVFRQFPCYSNRYLQETEMRLKLTQGYLRAAMVKSLKNAGMTHERLLTTMGEVKGRRGRDVDM